MMPMESVTLGVNSCRSSRRIQSLIKLLNQQIRFASFLSSDRVEYNLNGNNFTSEKERTKTVSAFYNQPAVDAAAAKVIIIIKLKYIF